MIIGLSGFAQVGKDTVAKTLVDDYGFEVRSFAQPMRDALYTLNPIVHAQGGTYKMQGLIDAYGWDVAKVQYPEIRRLLQVFGTEVGRKMFGENFWVNQAFAGVHSSKNVVFTDVRFPNEASMIKDFYGQVWRIERPGVHAVNNHPSESSMDKWTFDKIIRNDSDIEALQEKVALGLKVVL